MSDTRKRPGPPSQGFAQFPAQLRPDQIDAIRAEGALRGERQGNAVLRDIVDFWIAHRPFFVSWIAARNNLPPQAGEGK